MSQFTPTTIDGNYQQGDCQIFGFSSDDERIAWMKAQGARNVDPPLPRSSHLKIKTTGVVHPWNPLLATQQDIVECCDEFGNTDPAAWEPTVSHDEYDEDAEAQKLMQEAQLRTLQQAELMTSQYRVHNAVVAAPRPTSYPDGIVPLDQFDKLQSDVDKLTAMLE